MKKIICLGCIHGFKPQVESCDILIITGDVTARDTFPEYEVFDEWLASLPTKIKIVIAGNHDGLLLKRKYKIKNAIYLEDDTFDYQGLKFYAFPHSLSFKNINPQCAYFTGDEDYMAEKCALIPDDIDILISHSPPYGILDGIPMEDGSLFHVGSKSLRDAVLDGTRFKNLKYVIFSHIHEGYGVFETPLTKFVNCSIMNERYKPVNKPVTIVI